jgi:hypothetical protein
MVIQRMAVALWSSGWWNETLEMLQAFAGLDGRQERRFIITDTEAHPCPIEVINAAQAAFTEVHVYRTPFVLPPGTSAPRTLVGLAGHIAEKLRHVGPIMFMLPMLPSQPGSLDRLEQEHAEGMRAGRKVLGVIVGQGEERQPYGTFVVHREWMYDPNFPLAQGIGMNAESMHAMKYLRIEFLRSFRPTLSLLAVAGLAPDRNTFLKAFDLVRSDRKRPLVGTVHTPRVANPVTENDELDQLIAEAEGTAPADVSAFIDGPVQAGPAYPPYEEQVPEPTEVADLPDNEAVKARVLAEGIYWIGAEGYSEALVARGCQYPMFLSSIGGAYATYLRRQEALTKAKLEPVATESPSAPEPKAKAPQKKKAPAKPAIKPLVI